MSDIQQVHTLELQADSIGNDIANTAVTAQSREIATSDVEGKKSWERQTDEHTAAYHSFCMYRDFGPTRKIKKVLELHHLKEKNYSAWYRWSLQFNWQARVTAFDDDCDKERRLQAEVDKQKYFEAYKKALDKAFNKVDMRLDTINPNELSPAQAIDWLEKTLDLGSKVHGKPVKETEGSSEGQLEINFFDGFNGV